MARSVCGVPLHHQGRFAFPFGNGLRPPFGRAATAPLRSETKGLAGACPDWTRAIPCKLRLVKSTSKAVIPADLANGLLTIDADDPGYSWIRTPSATPVSSPIRQLRTDLDNRNLAADQLMPVSDVLLRVAESGSGG